MTNADHFSSVHTHEWLSGLADRLGAGQPQVLITVVHTQGSTPRDTGARMWVGTDFTVDTVGGGHLEWKAIASARAMLEQAEPQCRIERYPLGPSLGQCCGGVVWLLHEYLDRDDASWCAQIATVLAQGGAVERCVKLPRLVSPCTNIRPEHKPGLLEQGQSGSSFYDAEGSPNKGRGNSGNRRDAPQGTVSFNSGASRGPSDITLRQPDRTVPHRATFLDAGAAMVVDVWSAPVVHVVVCGAGHIGSAIIRLLADLPVQVIWLDPREECWPRHVPANVKIVQGDADDVIDMPDHAYWLVLTHSHALDLAIIDTVFRQKSFAFMGLIGSRSKKARFASRLSRRHSSEVVARICCPVGLVQTSSKLPSVIAVSVVAQLLGLMAA